MEQEILPKEMCEEDCRAPPEKLLDMRSTYYKYHKFIPAPMTELKENPEFPEIRKYTEDNYLEQNRISSYKQAYTWKCPDPDSITNPHVDCQVQFVKSFDETKLRFISRPMKPVTSLSHDDYVYHPPRREEPVTPISMPSPVQGTRIVIDRAKPGYSKYLDPSATVTKLDYVHYTPKELDNGIGAKDAVTYYSWKQTKTPKTTVSRQQDLEMCDTSSAINCPKRRLEYRNEVKRVPHTGMNTEHRDNYIEPADRQREFNVHDVEGLLLQVPYEPAPAATSAQLIGSGERTQTYL